MHVFSDNESEVRTYCRSFPALFSGGSSEYLWDINGKRWLDFFCSAGSLNLGHNPAVVKQAVVKYLEENGIVNALDFHTKEKRDYIVAFKEKILSPRSLSYKIQFTGPTGTDCVEAALRLARKVTQREDTVALKRSYHGMTRGAAQVSDSIKQEKTGKTIFVEINCWSTIEDLKAQYLRGMKPAAVIVEVVQCEGGIRIMDKRWLQELNALANEMGALFIVDDIQAGCGRTGKFFSFEHYGIYPDLVCLSKSLSGLGLPFAKVLIKPELDVWEQGEFTGTFRGGNLAFAAGNAALENFWGKKDFWSLVEENSTLLRRELVQIQDNYQSQISRLEQIGMLAGIEFEDDQLARQVQRECFDAGMIIETCGPNDSVLKIMPPLNCNQESIIKGVSLLNHAVGEVIVRGNKIKQISAGKPVLAALSG